MRCEWAAYWRRRTYQALANRLISAQLTACYTAEELIGRQVIAVLNFPPRGIAGFSSEVLVLGVPDESGSVILLQPEREVPLAGQVF